MFPDRILPIDDPRLRQADLVADGMLAVCLQHGIDHTNGIVFIDRMSRVRRDQARRQYSRNLWLASRRDRLFESANP